ncbi:MAG: hypothetical protein K0M73_07380, partial [Hydrogenophaga sp.]|nr:hypothetical protein [Hydrogenophaga sp.]
MKPSASLARMKALALGLLLLAVVIYVVATLLTPRHPAWAYVAAAAGAAVVGRQAGGFCLVGGFRHPLGRPLHRPRPAPRTGASARSAAGQDTPCPNPESKNNPRRPTRPGG